MPVGSVDAADSSVSYVRDTSKDARAMSVDTQTFLKLLVAQLKYQDPLSPQDNTAFVTQLAQMSSMEAMSNINATLKNSQAYDLIGKEIYAEVLDEATGKITGYNGIVGSIVIKKGIPYAVLTNPVVIKDGIPIVRTGSTAINLTDIVQVFEPLPEDESPETDDLGDIIDAPAAGETGGEENAADTPAAGETGGEENTADAPAAEETGGGGDITDAPAAEDTGAGEINSL